jgi:hypothetical protein
MTAGKETQNGKQNVSGRRGRGAVDAGDKSALFISRNVPILGKRFRFQAQYRFNRPAVAGGF